MADKKDTNLFDFGKDTEDSNLNSLSLQDKEDQQKTEKDKTDYSEKVSEKTELGSDHSGELKCPQIDVYERLNFQKLKVRRKKRFQTEIGGPSKILQKFQVSQEITKIVEEMNFGSKTDDHLRFNEKKKYFETKKSIDKSERSNDKEKKRTIKFSARKTTFQYPKEMLLVKDEDIKEKDEEDIFNFGA